MRTPIALAALAALALGCATPMYPGFPSHQDACGGGLCVAGIGAAEAVQGRETRKLKDAAPSELSLARALHVGAIWRADASDLFEPLTPCLEKGGAWSTHVTAVPLDEDAAAALAAKLEANTGALDPEQHAEAIALLRGISTSSIAEAFQVRYLELIDYDVEAGAFGSKTKCVGDYKVQPGDRLIVSSSVLDVAAGQREGAGLLVAELILTGGAQLEGQQFVAALARAAEHAAAQDPATTSSPFARIVALTYVTAR